MRKPHVNSMLCGSLAVPLLGFTLFEAASNRPTDNLDTGMPQEWQKILDDNGITKAEQEQNPDEVCHTDSLLDSR